MPELIEFVREQLDFDLVDTLIVQLPTDIRLLRWILDRQFFLQSLFCPAAQFAGSGRTLLRCKRTIHGRFATAFRPAPGSDIRRATDTRVDCTPSCSQTRNNRHYLPGAETF
jgi:hypothetical protein